jgi:hypothetical protein
MSNNTPERTRLLKNLRFLARRHRQTGLDVDYAEKLDIDSLRFLEAEMRRFYNGEGCVDEKEKKEANKRRYRAQQADAMGVSNYGDDFTTTVDDLDPEKLLLIKEEATIRKK